MNRYSVTASVNGNWKMDDITLSEGQPQRNTLSMKLRGNYEGMILSKQELRELVSAEANADDEVSTTIFAQETYIMSDLTRVGRSCVEARQRALSQSKRRGGRWR